MRAAPLVAFALMLTACSSARPVPIRAGDVCFHCRQTITDPSLAVEFISPAGQPFKFSSVGCLTEYLRDHPNETVKAIFVTDHARGKMLEADEAWYVKFPVVPRLNLYDYAAFREKAAAEQFAAKHQSQVVDWEAVRADRIGHGH